jgi:hypothetical protein
MKQVFVSAHKFTLLVWLASQLSCGGNSSGSRVAASSEPSVAGSLIIQLEPKDGADPSTVSGASLQVEGHPEIQAKADSTGQIQVNSILPGTLNVIVTSEASGSGFRLLSEADYGLKLDNIVISAGKANNLGAKKLQATGSLAGTVGFLTSNAVDPEGTLVYVPGTSFSAYTDANGRFALGGLPPGSYQLNFQRDGFAVTKLKDLVVEEEKATDLGPITLSLALGPEGGVTVTNGQSVAIGGQNKTLIPSRTVELAIRYDSDAALMKIGKDPAFLNQGWEAVAASKSITFDSEGEHAVYVMFADLNGLESSAYNVVFVIDTLAPELHEIAVLNGWSQTAPTDVYVTADITDDGSGIAQIRFSNTSSTLADASWQDYTRLNLWSLTSGAGGKTVYAQVKDYAGNVSGIVEDGIVVGTDTIIYGTSYQDDVTLKKAFGPYYIESDTTFASNLTIEEGTVIKIKKGVRVKLKGHLIAQGTVSQPIVMTSDIATGGGCSTTTDLTFFDMTEAAPGVTEKSRVEFVEFRYMDLHLNGGVFKNSTFSSSGCSGNFGTVKKVGLDRLTLQAANFVNHFHVNVQAGNGLTTIQEATGDLGYFSQTAQGANTILKQNSFTISTMESSMGFISLENGISFLGTNTFTFSHSSGKNLFHNKGTQNVTMSGIVVDDTTNSCNFLIMDESQDADVTIERSSIECGSLFGRMASPYDTGTIAFDRNILRVRSNLASLTSSGEIDLRLTKNDIQVTGTASAYGRLFGNHLMEYYTATSHIIMQGNKVDCSTSSYCYGFLAASYNASSGVLSPAINLNIDGNYWIGLPMNASIGTNVVRRSNSVSASFGDGTEHRIYEFDAGYDPTTDVDSINYTINVAAYTNLATEPLVGPSAP